jgi:hypothetical protein
VGVLRFGFPHSTRRLASAAASKSTEELSMEASGVDTAALLTLAGVGVVVANQWGASFTANDLLLRGACAFQGVSVLPSGFSLWCALLLEIVTSHSTLLHAGFASKARSMPVSEVVRQCHLCAVPTAVFIDRCVFTMFLSGCRCA